MPHTACLISSSQQPPGLDVQLALAARTAARASSSSEYRSAPSIRTVPDVGMSRPAMIESNVLLPDPEAPTMAADWRGSSAKSMSWRIVRVPVESRTCLVRRSTTTMGSGMGAAACTPSGRMGVTRRPALAHCSALLPAALFTRDARADAPQRILVVGDSLSAEYGLARGTG